MNDTYQKTQNNVFEELDNFSPHEFDSPDVPGSGYLMDEDCLRMLQVARTDAGIVFTPTSGYRTKYWNSRPSVGGSPTSSHLDGYAVDIYYEELKDAARIIAALARAGFRRIGLGSNFVHADNDPNKSEAYWDYS